MTGMELIVVALGWFMATGTEDDKVVVTPEEMDGLLVNPGMGWQTFHRFADEDSNLAGLPSSSAYFRLYWRDIEPEEGKVDFASFDTLLAHARRAGQKLAFRIMCVGTSRQSMYVPQWLRDKGCKGFEYQYQGSEMTYWVPDMDDPLFLETHLRLIHELGKRYDGHPDLDLVDIGTVGLWGEWHMSGTGVAVPSLETRLAIIDTYREAFPNTPKVMLIGDVDGLTHATNHACGWRADCLGDMGGFSPTWNHMEHFYRQQLRKCDAEEAWQVGPVAFESCWDMRKWHDEGWDIQFIFDYALELHASYLNNKSAPIPESIRAEIERFLRKVGYRLVLRRLEHNRHITAASSVKIVMQWENVGVAPPYRSYQLAFRLTSRTTQEKHVCMSETSVLGWLPGTVDVSVELQIPGRLAAGRYELGVGIVAPASQIPAVRLAIPGRTDDGWYPVSEVTIRK